MRLCQSFYKISFHKMYRPIVERFGGAVEQAHKYNQPIVSG